MKAKRLQDPTLGCLFKPLIRKLSNILILFYQTIQICVSPSRGFVAYLEIDDLLKFGGM